MADMKVYKKGDTYHLGYVSTTDGKFKSTQVPNEIAEAYQRGDKGALDKWYNDYLTKKAANVLVSMKNSPYGGKTRVRRHKKSKKHGHKKSKKHSRRKKSRRRN